MRNEETKSPASRVTPTHALLAGAVLGLVAMPLAFAGAKGPEATTSASAKKQIKSLQKRVSALEAQKAPTSLPPNGPAGGSLAGTYPNPTIGANKVGSPEIANDAVGTTEIANDAVTNAEVANDAIGSAEVINGSLGGVDLKNTYDVATGAGSPAANVDTSGTASCGSDRLLGGGYAWGGAVAGVSMDASAPNGAAGDNPNAWFAQGSNATGGVQLFVWATCLRL